MRLKQFFTGVAAKRLTAVETNRKVSNQHEFNGINRFKEILGTQRRTFRTVFLYMSADQEVTTAEGDTTWYDSREDDPKRSAEYRLYFPPTAVSRLFAADDLVIIARRPDDTLLVVASPSDSTTTDQLIWLFGLDATQLDRKVRTGEEFDRPVDFVVRWILDSIGIDAPDVEVDPEVIRAKYGSELPSSREFSEFARDRAGECDPLTEPDTTMLRWLEVEERLFKAFERLLIQERLRTGFVHEDGQVDVDGFISYSLSVQNRRKARAGRALENHIERILQFHRLRFERGVKTEGESKPDFLFPGAREYRDAGFPSDRLAILGAKATCKDRWRQLLDEADRVPVKHLLTLEPGISLKQTDAMRHRSVQLVVPAGIHSTYRAGQREWLWDLRRFIAHVRTIQV